MRIGFDASVMFSSVGGTRVYAAQLLAALMESRPEWEYFLYTRNDPQSADLIQRWNSATVHVVTLPGSPNSWRLQSKLPSQLNADRIDVYHSLGYFLPLLWRGPRVVTVHDLNVYLSWRNWMRPGKAVQWLDMAVQTPLALHAADRVIAVSEFSKESIVRLFRMNPRAISVIHNASDPLFETQPLQSELDEADKLTSAAPFVLFVGILSSQKNLDMLVRAFAASGLRRMGYRLVLAGSDREGEGVRLRRIAGDEGIGDALLILGFVPTPLLRALYHRALCLVLPSHGEGFGIPIVEAMACGAPVLAANRQAIPEVVGDAGLLFEPDDRDGLAALLHQLSKDTSVRNQLIQKGRVRSARFSWRSAAEATAAVYEEVCRSRR